MKQFLVILGLTALVWLGVSMSVERQYPLHLHLDIGGFDQARFAILQADTALDVSVQMSGFNAFYNTHLRKHTHLNVNFDPHHQSVATSELALQLQRQLTGVQQVLCHTDSVRVHLVERASKRYIPRLDKVDIAFADQYGLYGQPTLTPPEITLYGPQNVLDSIEDIYLKPCKLQGIRQSAVYTLPIEPVWENLVDLFPSTSQVQLTIPAEPYVEHTFQVPIQVTNADEGVEVHLYPPTAKISTWIAQRDLQRDCNFLLSVSFFDALRTPDGVPVHLDQFPSHVRIRNIDPPTIQCVIIR